MLIVDYSAQLERSHFVSNASDFRSWLYWGTRVILARKKEEEETEIFVIVSLLQFPHD